MQRRQQRCEKTDAKKTCAAIRTKQLCRELRADGTVFLGKHRCFARGARAMTQDQKSEESTPQPAAAETAAAETAATETTEAETTEAATASAVPVKAAKAPKKAIPA